MNPVSRNFSLSDYFRIIGPSIPDSILSSEHRNRLIPIAEKIPGLASFFFGFESRLGIEDPIADLLVCFKPHENGHQVLAGTHPAADLPKDFFTSLPWTRIRAFAQAWLDPSSPLFQRPENLWLEFDNDGSLPEIPTPCVFFGCHDLLRSTADVEVIHLATALAPSILLGQPLPASVEARLAGCVAALPPDAFVFQIGMMLSRPSPAVRICIRNIAATAIPDYLASIGWPGSSEELWPLLFEIGNFANRVDLDIDVSDTVSPKIGLECYLERQPRYQPKWASFLEYLVEKGACTPAKRDGLLAYPGYHHERQVPPGEWPEYLSTGSVLLGQNFLSMVTRMIHHIKIVHQPHTPMEAKAYLGVGHSWLNTEVIKNLRPPKAA